MTIGRPLTFVDHTHVTPEGDIECPKCGLRSRSSAKS